MDGLTAGLLASIAIVLGYLFVKLAVAALHGKSRCCGAKVRYDWVSNEMRCKRCNMLLD